jgi:hypothetical protein
MKTDLKSSLWHFLVAGSLLSAGLIGCNSADSGGTYPPPAIPAASNPGGTEGTTGQGRDQIPDDGGVIEPGRPLNPDKFSF